MSQVDSLKASEKPFKQEQTHSSGGLPNKKTSYYILSLDGYRLFAWSCHLCWLLLEETSSCYNLLPPKPVPRPKGDPVLDTQLLHLGPRETACNSRSVRRWHWTMNSRTAETRNSTWGKGNPRVQPHQFPSLFVRWFARLPCLTIYHHFGLCGQQLTWALGFNPPAKESQGPNSY